MKSCIGLTLLALYMLVTSCVQSTTVIHSPAEELSAGEQKHLQMPFDSAHIVYGRLKYSKAVYRFYNSHAFENAWHNDSSRVMADSLFAFLKSVRFYGLLPQNYHITELKNLENATHQDSIIRKEALLTDAFLILTNDLKYGRLNSVVNLDQDSLMLCVLENAFSCKEVKRILEAQEPIYKQYRDLKESLGRILRSTDSLNYKLLYSGITIDSLELHKKVQLVEVNMERWRLEKTTIEQRSIWINIPSFQLLVTENNHTIIKSKIIVGKPETPTPVLSSLVECIILYPYWYVPRKIATEEYLPLIQQDTSFLTRNNFDVLGRKGNVLDPDSLKWLMFSVNYFPVSLRQREGSENSLGVIKFMFDNPYAVFLHDTNLKNLFRKNVRAFSHGCIRMEKALELAKYLAPEPGKVDLKLRLRERYTVNLEQPIPIYIRYFTCEYVNGELNFYNDLYDMDKRIINLLYGTDAPRYDQNQTKS